MSSAFNNGRPDLVASDITDNNKGKAIYHTLVTETAHGTNYDGHVVFEDQIGTNYRSYELYQDATLGYNLCNDCSACTVAPAWGPGQPNLDTPLNPVSAAGLLDAGSAHLDLSGNWIIDASNNLIARECHENVDALLQLAQPGIPVVREVHNGNDLAYNYLYCYDFPAKIAFLPQ